MMKVCAAKSTPSLRLDDVEENGSHTVVKILWEMLGSRGALCESRCQWKLRSSRNYVLHSLLSVSSSPTVCDIITRLECLRTVQCSNSVVVVSCDEVRTEFRRSVALLGPASIPYSLRLNVGIRR